MTITACPSFIWTPSHRRRFCSLLAGHEGEHSYPATGERDEAPPRISEAQQDRRETDRALEGACDACGGDLYGEIVATAHGFVHEACIRDIAQGKVDADDTGFLDV